MQLNHFFPDKNKKQQNGYYFYNKATNHNIFIFFIALINPFNINDIKYDNTRENQCQCRIRIINLKTECSDQIYNGCYNGGYEINRKKFRKSFVTTIFISFD